MTIPLHVCTIGMHASMHAWTATHALCGAGTFLRAAGPCRFSRRQAIRRVREILRIASRVLHYPGTHHRDGMESAMPCLRRVDRLAAAFALDGAESAKDLR
jgi:hypothetical protein